MTIQVSQVILASLVVIGFFGCLIVMMINPEALKESNREAVMIMVGALVAGFSGLMGYFFGSSAGSAKKTEIIASQKEDIVELTKPIQ